MRWVICGDYDNQHAISSDRIRSVLFVDDPRNWYKSHNVDELPIVGGERIHDNPYDIIIETDDGKYHLFYHGYNESINGYSIDDGEYTIATIIHQRLLLALANAKEGTIIISEYDEDMVQGIYPHKMVLVIWDRFCDASPMPDGRDIVYNMENDWDYNPNEWDNDSFSLPARMDGWWDVCPGYIKRLENDYPLVYTGKIKVTGKLDGE